jgi:hypothetical protein
LRSFEIAAIIIVERFEIFKKEAEHHQFAQVSILGKYGKYSKLGRIFPRLLRALVVMDHY